MSASAITYPEMRLQVIEAVRALNDPHTTPCVFAPLASRTREPPLAPFGYVIEEYDDGNLEVEVSDPDGSTIAQFVASQDELELAQEEPASASEQPHPADNCAEVAACSQALAAGAHLNDLVTYTVEDRVGAVLPAVSQLRHLAPGSSTMSTRALRALQTSGWHEGREVSTKRVVDLLLSAGSKPWVGLIAFLAEFDQLTARGPSKSESVWIDAAQAISYLGKPWVDEYQAMAGVHLAPVGGQSHLMVLLGDNAKFYGSYDRVFGWLADDVVGLIQALLYDSPTELPRLDF